MDFNKIQKTIINELNDSFYTEKSDSSLTKIAEVTAVNQNIDSPCDTSSDIKNCNRRWIEAQSDCA